MLLQKVFLRFLCITFLVLTIAACGSSGGEPDSSRQSTNTQLGGDSSATVFNLSSASYTTSEGQTVSVTITRSNGVGAASVRWGTNGQTASHGSDYWGFDGQLVDFADGVVSRTLSIETINNSIAESNETFEVLLSSPSSDYTLGNISVAEVTIFDDDSANAGQPPTDTNTPPTIGGTPITNVQANTNYAFTPVVNDVDGNTLTFNVQNAPVWADFDTSTGTLSGSPTTGDVGTTTGIIISVSDGLSSASLPAFDITVDVPSPPGDATLSWTPPTQNVDGTALTDLAGFRIYYGTSLGNYPNIIEINNRDAITYFIDNLPGNNTYYFVVTAIDSQGNESGFSNIASKTLP